MTCRLLIFLMLSLFFLFSVVSAEDNLAALPAQKTTEDTFNSSIVENTSEQEFEIPDWLKRTNYGISIESDQEPRFYLETVQPLHQSWDKLNTLFTHNRISIQGERGTYSAGLGYRKLIFDEHLMAGLNTFFDYQDKHQHYRQGIGLEAIGQRLEWRLNSYFRLSPKRLVEESSTTKIYEQVANGFDTELGGPLPYLPWFKVFGNFYHYNYKKAEDMNGWKARGEIKPFDFFVINLETFDDNKGEQEYKIDTCFNLAFHDFTPHSLLSAFKFSKQPYPDVDLKERSLDRVERSFKVTAERWTETGNVTVAIGRAN